MFGTYEIAVIGVVVSVVAGGVATVWLLARHERASPAAALGLFMLPMTFWSLTHLGTLLAETQRWQLTFTQLSYLSVVTAPILWLAFALRYTGRGDWLSGRRTVALSVVPAVTLALVFTAQFHDLFYQSMWMASVRGHPLLHVESGPWHVVNIVYGYVLLLAGTGILFGAALSDSRLYRRQSAVLVGAVTVPWMVNVTYHLGFRPIPWVDPTPIAFVAMGIPLAAVVVHSDLASYLPVAHERVFRTLEDPILVVAPDGTVIDANRAARTILGAGDPLDGAPAADAFPDDLLDGDGLVGNADETALQAPVECKLDHDGETRRYLARRRAVDPDSGAISRGTIVTLTDITVQKRQQNRLEDKTERLEIQTDHLERKNEQLERLADIVSHDLQAPLSTADKLTTLLDRDLEDPTADIERTVADLEGVHDRLRAFADHLPRLARESTDVESAEECDLAEVTRAAWSVVDTADVDLETESTRPLRADARRLQQVFENLFRNAAALATPRGDPGMSGAGDPSTDGGVDASTDTGEGESAGDAADAVSTVRVAATDHGFYVADDGPGIPDEVGDEVFEYGVGSGDGSGFGLAIVRTIVEAHGWTIDVSESESGGARFEVRTVQ